MPSTLKGIQEHRSHANDEKCGSDNDLVMYNNFDKTANQVSIYGARGMLIESQGPSWFYGTGSEHSVLYQYQLNEAQSASHTI